MMESITVIGVVILICSFIAIPVYLEKIADVLKEILKELQNKK